MWSVHATYLAGATVAAPAQIEHDRAPTSPQNPTSRRPIGGMLRSRGGRRRFGYGRSAPSTPVTTPPRLQDLESGLLLSPLPVWVADLDTMNVHWANDPALALWRADSREELLRRDLLTGAPEKVLARLRHVASRVRAGEVLCEEWTFYPRGQPTTQLLHLRAVLIADGRVGMLNHAVPLEIETSPSTLRALAAIRHLTTPVAYVGETGDLRMQNPAAMAVFGDVADWPAWFVDPAEARRILAAVGGGEVVRAEVRVRGRQGERWHAVEAHTLRDPVLGDLGTLVLHADETARVVAEQTAAAQLALVEAQRREILALSAPILSVGAHTLALPLIGRLDAERSREITDRLLHTIASEQARRVIVDLTGVGDMDEPSVQRLRALFAAIRLLGAATLLTGVRADFAVRLAEAGLTGDDALVLRSLAEALHHR